MSFETSFYKALAEEIDVGEALGDFGRPAVSHYGVEMLGSKGWTPERSFWKRQVKRYQSEREAVEAAVKVWKRTDLAARPFAVPL